jgi:hypothetical protein
LLTEDRNLRKAEALKKIKEIYLRSGLSKKERDDRGREHQYSFELDEIFEAPTRHTGTRHRGFTASSTSSIDEDWLFLGRSSSSNQPFLRAKPQRRDFYDTEIYDQRRQSYGADFLRSKRTDRQDSQNGQTLETKLAAHHLHNALQHIRMAQPLQQSLPPRVFEAKGAGHEIGEFPLSASPMPIEKVENLSTKPEDGSNESLSPQPQPISGRRDENKRPKVQVKKQTEYRQPSVVS